MRTRKIVEGWFWFNLMCDFAIWLRFLGICAIVHNRIVFWRAPRVVGCPPDNGQTVFRQFDLWSLGDPDVRDFLGRRNKLSEGRTWEDLATAEYHVVSVRSTYSHSCLHL